MSNYILRPSNTRWPKCAGSVRACRELPEKPSSPAARRGTACHWVSAEVLTSGGTKSCADYIGLADPDGEAITDEMAEAAQVYVDEVLRVCEEYGGPEKLLVEHPVKCVSIHPTALGGRVDTALYVPLPVHKLIVWDGKFGRALVCAEGNDQLVEYAVGVIDDLGVDVGGLSLELNIVQPCAYRKGGPVDTWAVSAKDLRGRVDALRRKARAIVDEGYDGLSAGAWCRYCPAVGKCPAARRMAYDLGEIPYDLDDMSGPDLAAEREVLLQVLPVVKDRLDAIEALIEHQIDSGDYSSGLTPEKANGKWEYSVGPEAAIRAARMFGLDIGTLGCLTPTQTVSKAPKEMRPAVKKALEAITRRKEGARKLVKLENTFISQVFRRR